MKIFIMKYYHGILGICLKKAFNISFLGHVIYITYQDFLQPRDTKESVWQRLDFKL